METITGMSLYQVPFELWVEGFRNKAVLVLQMISSWDDSDPGTFKNIGVNKIPFVRFVLSTRIFYRGVRGLPTDYPYGFGAFD